MTVSVTPNGVMSLTTPASYMTYASVPAPVFSLLSSPLIRHYCSPLPSPYALGQQVIVYCLLCLDYCLTFLLSDVASSYAIVRTAYCLRVPIVLLPLYCDYLCLLLGSINSI